MATDNVVLNPGVGGNTVRALARQSGTAETQVVQLDIGGGTANPEVLVTAGQQLMANSISMAFAYDMPTPPGDRITNFLLATALQYQATPPGQFVVAPDIPFFLTGI